MATASNAAVSTVESFRDKTLMEIEKYQKKQYYQVGEIWSVLNKLSIFVKELA